MPDPVRIFERFWGFGAGVGGGMAGDVGVGVDSIIFSHTCSCQLFEFVMGALIQLLVVRGRDLS